MGDIEHDGQGESITSTFPKGKSAAVISIVGLLTATASLWTAPVKNFIDKSTTDAKVELFTISPLGEVKPGAEIAIQWKVSGSSRVSIDELNSGVLAAEGSLKYLAPLESQDLHLRVTDLKGKEFSEKISLKVAALPDPTPDQADQPSGQEGSSEATADSDSPSSISEAEAADSQSPPTVAQNESNCLKLSKIIALRDGSVGSTDWRWSVKSPELGALEIPYRAYSDSDKGGLSLPGNCLPLGSRRSGKITVVVTGHRKKSDVTVEGRGSLIVGSLKPLIAVRHAADERKGSFLLEFEFDAEK